MNSTRDWENIIYDCPRKGHRARTLLGVLRQNRSAGFPRRYIPDIRDIDFNGRTDTYSRLLFFDLS